MGYGQSLQKKVNFLSYSELFSPPQQQPFSTLLVPNSNSTMSDIIRSNAFSSMASGDVSDLIKTKMCLYYKAGCTNKNCSFAHSKEELNPPMCRFGMSCRKNDCYFYHPGQSIPSKNDLFFRATNGIKFVEPTPTKPVYVKQVIEPVSLIINLEESDDEEDEIVEVSSTKVERVTDGEEKEEPSETVVSDPTEPEETEKTEETVAKIKEVETIDCDDMIDQQEAEEMTSEIQTPVVNSVPSTPQPMYYSRQSTPVFFQPPPPQAKRRVQIEVMLTSDELMGLMSLLRSNNTNPILLSMG